MTFDIHKLTTDIKVNTFDTGHIEMITNDFMGRETKRIIDTHEAMLRKALIQLGWTPPEGKPTCK